MQIFPDRSFRAPARLFAAFLGLGIVSAGTVLAQTPADPAAPGSPAGSAAPDPVLATVNGQPIHSSDLTAAIETLPPQARSMPPQQLYTMMLEQLIDGRALVFEAQKTGLDKDPAVERQMAAAQERALQSALLNKVIRPQVSDEAVKARYDQQMAGKSGEPEVHARHILVADEATAKKVIAELKKGGDFAALSKQYSKDPGAAQQGGDLGFFKKTDMVPAFATAAFELKDGEVTQIPVHTQFGWHVIQVIERRTDAPQSYEQARDEIRQSMVQAAVQKEVAQARAEVKVEKFNPDGSPIRATDTAEPPPAK
jgi:peptidyl-prolyl cis-trans isomerase C